MQEKKNRIILVNDYYKLKRKKQTLQIFQLLTTVSYKIIEVFLHFSILNLIEITQLLIKLSIISHGKCQMH